MNELTGVHHVTAITSSAEKNYAFFTEVLGMRLVKKTVNQDDVQTYHLFFADDKGSAGTDMTFFDFPGIPQGRHGTDEIRRTSFRIPTDASLDYWQARFERLNVSHDGITTQFGVKILPFVDFDNQHYQLVSDEGNQGVESGTPWQLGPIPLEHAITGLGPVQIITPQFSDFKQLLEIVFQFKEVAQEQDTHLFEMGSGGNGASLLIVDQPAEAVGYQGFGTVHHVAFRVEDRATLNEWIERLHGFGLRTSGYVNRHFFESLYTRVSGNILFEIATDGPGFMGDEPYETLGEKLSLPPFLEAKRFEIEQQVRPINTIRSTRHFDKE